ncbi:MAG: entericidin A/B family lipoprotein [Opitutales bacterium]|nr:entericidin A/B family lipoprotein [Opitutales bacterium]
MKPKTIRSISLCSIFVALTLIGAMIISGCNTMDGFGKDTEATGEAIQDAAR